MIRFADSGRRTHAMKREGMRGGSSSEGVEVPDSLGPWGGGLRAFRSEREDRTPERMPIPRVPRRLQYEVLLQLGKTSTVHTTTKDSKGKARTAAILGIAIDLCKSLCHSLSCCCLL